MVWICLVCNGKNNNSSVKCRINKCHAPKPIKVIEKEQKKLEKQEKRDLCPTCGIHRDFTHVTKNQWKCPVCKKLYRFKGKPVPEVIPEVIINE